MVQLNICYSGGAIGSDTIFESEAIIKGYDVVAYSFDGHTSESKNRIILSPKQLKEGYEHIKIANLRLNRNISNLSLYVRNLISRDWFQVKNSDTIFAIGMLDDEDNVKGGTGYAISCAIDNKKPIFFFEQTANQWYYYGYDSDSFEIYEDVPKLTNRFAGIGTRDINLNGINAIKSLFR